MAGVAIHPDPDARGWYSIEGTPTAEAMRALQSVAHIERLSVTKAERLTPRVAQRFVGLQSVRWLWLWCSVTKPAMRHIVRIPGLEVLDVLNLTKPGKLADLGLARSLHTIRCNHYLSESDLFAIAECASLKELGIQSSELTPKALDQLLLLKSLRSLDVEGTRFDDEMAAQLSASSSIEVLDVGGTRITAVGLKYLASMKQLRSLDLWATSLDEDDLELLLAMPALEYVSIGNYDHLPGLDAKRVTDLLLAVPGLKRVWLDGVTVTADQCAALEGKLDSVRVS